MDYSQEVYVTLVWLFSGLFSLFMLMLCGLIIVMRNLHQRESQSRAFSYLAIEGMETERRRISRELHDVVLPKVSGQEVYKDIRTICMDLMPPDFTRLSLNDSLSALCNKFTVKTGIQCACLIENKGDFSWMKPESKLQLFRIVQEAFTNIEKHSRCQTAALVVRSETRGDTEYLVICISDEGVGLMSQNKEGLGMKSMQQRAKIIGAKLEFITGNENGLMVMIEIGKNNA